MGKCSVAPHCRTKIQGAGLDPHLGGGEGRFRGGDGCLGIRGWRPVGLGIFKVGGVGSGSNLAPWILCSAVRAISKFWAYPSIGGWSGPHPLQFLAVMDLEIWYQIVIHCLCGTTN